jgi:hypothetical protein
VLIKTPVLIKTLEAQNPDARTPETQASQCKTGRAATLRKYARTPLILTGAGLAIAGVVAASTGSASAATAMFPARTPLSGQHSPAPALTVRAGRGQQSSTRGRQATQPPRPTRGHRVTTAAARHRRPLADRLLPVGVRGTQAWMPISAAQLSNARTIVHQALSKGMGVRSAVIAVATAMQESQLVNISYGTSDSLGLFQQQPDCGWGTAQQVMKPAYAADAFLTALRAHQAADRGWARQPLWVNAQAVQKSGFPFAYAKWETQAAHLVRQISD